MKILSVPSSPGSVIFSSKFFTANPMPYSLVLSAAFPCQKKVKSFSQREPVSARRVSCSAVISTCSLHASFMSCRSVDRPVVIVLSLMFQHPAFSACLFLVLLFLSGLGIYSPFVGLFCHFLSCCFAPAQEGVSPGCRPGQGGYKRQAVAHAAAFFTILTTKL